MATCIKCGEEIEGTKDKPGTSICQGCVTILLDIKTPEELLALAKVGLDAVIDEVTGYEAKRPEGDLARRHDNYKR